MSSGMGKHGDYKEYDKSMNKRQEGREVVSKSQDHVSAQNVSQSSSSKLKRKSSESSSSSPSSSSSVVPEKKSALSIQLNASKVKTKNEPLKKPKVASVFNNDSESDEEEEMPLECRMKMRNIGRDTITSAGPKSYGKGRQGFTNHSFRKFQLSMKPRNSMEKQTTYNPDDDGSK